MPQMGSGTGREISLRKQRIPT